MEQESPVRGARKGYWIGRSESAGARKGRWRVTKLDPASVWSARLKEDNKNGGF